MFGIIETMVFHLSTPWVLLGPWFSVFPPCEYYSDRGFPKSTVIAAIQPMASIRQERVSQARDLETQNRQKIIKIWDSE